MHGFNGGADWSFLHDLELEQVCVGLYDVQLRFSGLTVSIWGAFEHTTTAGPQPRLDRVPDQAKSLLSLLGNKIRSVSVPDPTTLSIGFSNGESLTIHDHPQYEALGVVGDGRKIIV